jgi:SAM-dependent methyltransferase
MAACEKELWWYRCLHDLTINSIKKNSTVANPRLLDAGCGTGGLLTQLKDNGYTNIHAFDLSTDAVDYARKTSGIDVQLLDLTKLDSVYAPASFDIVTSHDTLCLLEMQDARITFIKLLAALKPGGLLLMNFPALKAFNGTHDIAVGIKRRYSKKDIREMAAGVAIIKEISYWPFLLSPLIFLMRGAQRIKLSLGGRRKEIISDVKMPPAFFNKLCYQITSFENKVFGTKAWGSSLFVILQKPVE